LRDVFGSDSMLTLKSAQQLKITGGCHIIIPSVLLDKVGGDVPHTHLHVHTEVDQSLLDSLDVCLVGALNVALFERAGGCGAEGFFRPGKEPVYGATVDQSGKGSDSPSETFSHRGESQHQVQIFLALLNEIGVFLVHSADWHHVGHFFYNFGLFFHREEIRHFPVVQQITNVFQHVFILHLRV